MICHMLANIICHEFEKVVGKSQHESGKAMHVGFHLPPEGGDQYHVVHLYLHAPMNYVYVVVQAERITRNGKRVVGTMELLCYHDSCWRDSVQQWIYKNRDKLSTLVAFDQRFHWYYDVLTLSEDEKKYLRALEQWKYSFPKKEGEFDDLNPFDGRGIWAGKA